MYIQGQIYINKSAGEICDAAFTQFVLAICVQLVSDLQRQQQQHQQQQKQQSLGMTSRHIQQTKESRMQLRSPSLKETNRGMLIKEAFKTLSGVTVQLHLSNIISL